MSGSAPALAVLAEHVIQTALNLFFPFLLLFWGKHRGKAFQHNRLSLEGDGSCFSLVGYRLYHLGLLSESGLKPSVSLLSCGETRKGSARQRALPLRLSPRFGPACPRAPPPFIYHFIFQAFSVHLRNYFLKIFPCSEARARLPGAPPFRPRLRPWQCRSCSCRGQNGHRYVWPVCRAGWKWPHRVPAW